MPYLCTRLRQVRALSSVGLEHLPYKQRVGGSNPSAPTTILITEQGGEDLFFTRSHTHDKSASCSKRDCFHNAGTHPN